MEIKKRIEFGGLKISLLFICQSMDANYNYPNRLKATGPKLSLFGLSGYLKAVLIFILIYDNKSQIEMNPIK